MWQVQDAVHCTRNTVRDVVHCTVVAPGALEEERQNLDYDEALTIPILGISRKSPDPGPRPEGATTLPEQKINPNRGEKLRSMLSIANTSVKLRKSKKHRNNPDKFKQMTLRVNSTEVIK